VKDPADDPDLARFYGQRLIWGECLEGAECARLTVPLDWSAPAAETITVAVGRVRASGERLGALVFNPGGPGVAAQEYAGSAKELMGDALAEHYDFVAMDPRGVGRSEPQIRCGTDAQTERRMDLDTSPDDPAEVAQAVREEKLFAADCQQNTGKLLAHVDSVSVARDIDVLRDVLGERQLVFWGASYGTFLGAWYAETFPWRVGRMLLDGAVDPSLAPQAYLEGQSRGFSQALRRFVEHCQDGRRCPLTGDVEQGIRTVGDLMDRVDRSPLRTDSGRRLTQSRMYTGMAQGLYNDTLWDELTDGLREALRGEGTMLLRLADTYLGRDENGRYTQEVFAGSAIYCLDHPEERTIEQIQGTARELGRRYPPFGADINWGAIGCSLWPIPNALRPQRLTAEGAAPILVVGTVEDPATPYDWAKSLASQLSSGRLLTWEGSGHTAFRRGNRCIDRAVEEYLISGTLPPEGKRCPAEG
jgi:pimeloyl-ACP methyl ester carboxylesterase